MKSPSKADKVVKVSAYLTDESFGYDHWRAAQFSVPVPPEERTPALLLLFNSEEERDQWQLKNHLHGNL